MPKFSLLGLFVLGVFIALLSFSAKVQGQNSRFPFDVQVTITKIEAWPSQGRYAAWVEPAISQSGCPHTASFEIADGPGEEPAYATILAAALNGKKIELYIIGCLDNYRPLADRVRLIP